MIKKFFLMTIFLVLLFSFSEIVQAETGTNTSTSTLEDVGINHQLEFSKKCKLINCSIPIPTLMNADNNIYQSNQNFYLTGLTWNNTLIEVYVDGIYRGSATINESKESDIANFYYQIEKYRLTSGEHKWSVIAWSKNERDRSFVSQENNFFVKLYVPSKGIIIPENDVKEIDTEKENDSVKKSSTQQELPSDNEALNISATSSDESELYVGSNQEIGEVSITNDETDSREFVVLENNSQENLVVDQTNQVGLNQDQELDKSNQSTEEKLISESNEIASEIQPAVKDTKIKDVLVDSLDFSEKQARNRKIGIFLLIALGFVVIFSTIFSSQRKE